MTEWTVSGHTIGTGRQCYELALDYRDAIDRFLECLKEVTPSAKTAREMQKANEWKSILSSDLSYLSKFRMHGPKSENTALNGQNGEYLETNRSQLPIQPFKNRSAI